jgi:hypothetical protein
VVQTAYLAEPLAGDWPQRLASTISAMERAMPANPMTPSDRVLYARLQLLYLAAGRNAEALQALPASSSTAQQSWNNMMTGLAAWLDIDRIPSDSCRDAESQHWLAKAVAKLSESAPLAIHNIAFCTEVKGFGNIKRCEKNEFTPNQEVLLYAEIENFLSESTPKGFHTSLQSNYEIVDASGQGVVTKQVFPPTEEDCQSIRRDFFIGYRVRLPKHMAPGQYVLQLTIEDLKAHKIGQTPIEFAVKDESKKKGWLGLPSLP